MCVLSYFLGLATVFMLALGAGVYLYLKLPKDGK